MAASHHSALDVTTRLRRALDATAAALAGVKLDDLLAAGEELEAALVSVPCTPPGDPSQHAALKAEIDAARTGLLRCRRLGANLTDFIRASLDARGASAGYEPMQRAAAELSGRGFTARA